MKPGRNDPSPCGSGRKYKHCCQSKESGGVRQANAGQLMHASPLLDAPAYARALEAHYRQIWRQWCSQQGQPHA